LKHFNQNDANTAFNTFENTFLQHVNKYIPTKHATFNKYKHKQQAWITKGLLKSMKTKEKLYVDMIKSQGLASFIPKQIRYKTYNSIYLKCIRQAKKIHWKYTFEKTKSDMKKTWDNINMVINNKKKDQSYPSTFTHLGREYRTPTEIANGFNHYFTNVGPNLAEQIPQTDKTASEFLPHESPPSSFFLTPTTHHEIAKIIEKMKPKTSCGHDQISPKLVKKCSEYIIHPLTHIANLAMSTGVFPNRMKTAKVITIYKKNDPSYFENYRPISLLPTFSKIIERLIYNRLYKYLITHELLTPSQYGFRKNLSTNYAILELQDRIIKYLSNKEWCVGIYLDLSRAFDTLDHSILLSKLQHIGIRGISLNLINSYLSNRKQFTTFLNVNSNTTTLKCGVPQGSILGPLLFIIYINDLSCNLHHSNSIIYADDTNIILHNKDFNTLTENANTELCNINNWFAANRLSLNIQKSTYMIFHNPQRILPVNDPNLHIGHTTIEKTDHTKFLGAHIDKNLNWKHHLTTKCNQIVKVICILHRLKHMLPFEILKTIYNALILPHLTYAITAFGNTTSKEMTRLITLQKKAIRTIFNAKYNSHTDPLFKKLNSLKIRDIFTIECVKIVLKNRQNLLPPYFSQQLLTNNDLHSHNTRQRNNIHYLPIRSKLENQLINTKLSEIWNKIPVNIKESLCKNSTLSVNPLKQYILSTYQNSCNLPNCFVCNQTR